MKIINELNLELFESDLCYILRTKGNEDVTGRFGKLCGAIDVIVDLSSIIGRQPIDDGTTMNLICSTTDERSGEHTYIKLDDSNVSKGTVTATIDNAELLVSDNLYIAFEAIDRNGLIFLQTNFVEVPLFNHPGYISLPQSIDQ